MARSAGALHLLLLAAAVAAVAQFQAFVCGTSPLSRTTIPQRSRMDWVEFPKEGEAPTAGKSTRPSPPEAAKNGMRMLDVIYINKYLTKNQKELKRAMNYFSNMDPYMKGRIPAFIEKTNLLNMQIPL
eukprot:TRINITY_DN2438_c0_g2_i1.p1 TRINITY_DN2438_c0_g2~~TRINITY_DN2438_c0_g2_i1.p1  ORF type:complete len:128 (-),score=32.54 TRINITY_DN2438_c0_g2_i1:237-620(-)